MIINNLRLSPSYMILLMFLTILTRYLGKGPVYPADGFEINMCKDTWWTNLLCKGLNLSIKQLFYLNLTFQI